MEPFRDTGVPPPFRQVSANSVEIRQGGGLLILLGLPILISGAFLVVMGVGLLPVELTGTGTPEWFEVTGLIFSVIGALVTFGRQRLTIDVARGVVVRQRSYLIPLAARERSLVEFDAVVVAFRAGDGETPDRYPVLLRAISGKNFAIHSTGSFADSLRQAEYLSHWLRLPLVDTTTNRTTVVSPEHSGDSYRQRAAARPPEFTVPPPAQIRSRIEESSGQVRIAIPARGASSGWIFALLFSTVSLVLFMPALRRMLERGGAPPWSLVFALLGMPLIVAVLQIFGRRQGQSTIIASSSGLEIVRRGRRAQTTRIAANEILDVDLLSVEGALEAAGSIRFAKLARLVPSRGIIVKSRQGLIAFGEGLPEGELRYLAARLRKALAGQL